MDSGCGLLLVLAAGGFVGWQWWHRPKPSVPVDMVKVLELNQRGAALMDQYRFKEASEVYEELGRLAPDWIPGKINRGIVLFVRGNNPEGGTQERNKTEKQILDLFNQVLAVEPDNAYANYNIGYLYLDWKSQMDEAGSYFQKVVKKDPNDAFAWYWLGRCQEEKPEAAIESFRRAVELDPYHSAALYGLQAALKTLERDKEAAEAMDSWERLSQQIRS